MLDAMEHPPVRDRGRGARVQAPSPRLFAGALLVVVLMIAVTACVGRHGSVATPSPTRSTSTARAREARVWVTTADGRSTLTERPAAVLHAGSAPGTDEVLSVKSRRHYHPFWGVGASMTEASATLVSGLAPAAQDELMATLFGRADGAGLSILRQPLAANDFSPSNRSYDPAPEGQPDPGLRHFSLGGDTRVVLPLVRRAQQLNRSLTVVVSPWSAPAWMKTSGTLVGGTLRPDMGSVYARYLVRTLQAYRDAGVHVRAMTLQNEPSFSPPGYPGMTLTVSQQRQLLDTHLAPALAAAGLAPAVWALDDNYDRAADAAALVADPATRSHLAGVAFHCYRGDPSSMRRFSDSHPDVPVAISECTSGHWENSFSTALAWDVRNLLISGIRDGATWVTKWNLALDPSGGPTNGGCGDCRGLVTIDPGTGQVTRHAGYWALAHLGRFVTPGADVIASTTHLGGIETVAFVNPDGSHVLLATNAGSGPARFTVQADDRWFRSSLPAGAVATFTW